MKNPLGSLLAKKRPTDCADCESCQYKEEVDDNGYCYMFQVFGTGCTPDKQINLRKEQVKMKNPLSGLLARLAVLGRGEIRGQCSECRTVQLLVRDFSKTPGPRLKTEGDFSGEEFRESFLLPLLLKSVKENNMLQVDLDGTSGYSCAFLEEIFGGLIRSGKISCAEIDSHLEVISTEEDYILEDIPKYLREAMAGYLLEAIP